MLTYSIRRLILAIPVLLLISLLVDLLYGVIDPRVRLVGRTA